MSATVNSFPAFQSLNSPRAWTLAVIVLLHAGFFWALNTGLSRQIVTFIPPDIVARFLKEDVQPLPPPPPPPDYQPRTDPFVMPTEPVPYFGTGEETGTIHVTPTPQPVPTPVPTPRPAPVVAQPQIDPARALSEPAYPAQDVRLGNTGTVLLSVLVLPDGKVGDVRLDRSSGFSRLDASAMTEAKKWRFKPGTQDGVPTAMWKQLPITFRLQN